MLSPRKFLRKRYISRKKTIAELIRIALDRNSKKTALVYRDRALTYNDLAKEVKQASAFLHSQDLKQNDRIAVCLPDSTPSIVLRLACHLNGIEIMLIPNDFSSDTIHHIIAQTQPRFTIVPAESNQCLNAPTLCYQSSERTDSFIPAARPAPENAATINFTSGSTGRPRGIRLCQSSWAASCHAFVNAANSGHKHQQTYLPLIPCTLAGSTSLIPALLAGMKIVLPGNWDMQKLSNLINEYHVNFIFLTPLWLAKWMKSSHSGIKHPSLNKIAIGTDTVHAAILQRAIEMFGPIISCGYGMAEVLPPLTVLGPEDYKGLAKNHPVWCSVGKPHPHVDISILDEKGNKHPRGNTGRICIHSPSRAQGYIDATTKESHRFKNNGSFISEDLGYLDEKGYLYIRGRANQRFETFARQLFARDIEELCLQNSQVSYACAVKHKKTICIAVAASVRDVSRLQCALLSELCNAIPNTDFKIKIIREMPETAAGKADRQAVCRLYESRGDFDGQNHNL
ncbi:AMP-binding protein [candidate division KSB1 bacterium]|nr:AMP-binding protein [candidate division KSB1 bacterium]